MNKTIGILAHVDAGKPHLQNKYYIIQKVSKVEEEWIIKALFR